MDRNMLEANLRMTRNKELYTLATLGSVDEKTVSIDELLYEAVEKNSIRSVQALLNIALSDEHRTRFGNGQSSHSTDSVTANLPWKKKANARAVLLAAQRGNREMIKVFLSRGFRIERPHEYFCGCWECKKDPLGSTKTRMAEYLALCNPIWISLTSKDPFLTAFSLHHELSRLQNFESSYENAVSAMKEMVQNFCTDLLDCVENTSEQYKIINMEDENDFDARDDDDYGIDGLDMKQEWSLKFIKRAFRYKLKKVVAHPIPQHAIASLVQDNSSKWWTGSRFKRALYVLGKSVTFPFSALAHLFFPCSSLGRSSQIPLVRFINGASSFVTFLGLLGTLSALPAYGLRIGKAPSYLEWVIFIWIISLLVAEVSQLSHVGRHRYFTSGWNLMDVFMIIFMLTSYCIWVVLYFITASEIDSTTATTLRRIANGLFTCGTIMSFFRLVYLCQITRFLGLLQLCLGRMIEVIFQFAFISFVVLWSFSVGMVFLYNSLSPNERHQPSEGALLNRSDVQVVLSKGFNGLPATMVTLAWASMNMVGLGTLQEFDDGGVTYLWSAFLFTTYYMVSMIVLLNMLIAMMSNSYQQIENNIEVEHKYAKTQLLVDYITVKNFQPCPFNLIPTWHFMKRTAKKIYSRINKSKNLKQKKGRQTETEYEKTVNILVERYLRKHPKENVIIGHHHQIPKPDVIARFDERVQDFIAKWKLKDSPRKMPSFEDSGLDISFNGDHSGEISNQTDKTESRLTRE